jgi:RNA polymerase sigma-70 factor (ECF subfamily)
MDAHDLMIERFEQQRPKLRAVAYRMLGSTSEADDALQEAWLRVSRADSSGIDNPDGWLTTVTARVCLNMLRSRRTRREEPLEARVPDPVVTRETYDPSDEIVLADSVGLALLVVLETLDPAERLAFVLHDMFAVPFDEIAPMVERSPEATRQLASRARRRVHGAEPPPDADPPRQREVVDAFFAAARGGDFEALISVLDPDVVLRSDGGPKRAAASAVVRGAENVASRVVAFALPRAQLRPVRVNGEVGVVVIVNGRVLSILGFTVRNGRIVAIDALADPDRLRDLDLSAVDQ